VSRPDPREEARRWLAQAENDLSFTEHSIRGGFHAQACFHSQQVAEKAVKAVHYLRGARVVIGHSVDGLLEALETAGLSVKELRPLAAHLDLHYIPTRYPNGLPGNLPFEVYTAAQASDALAAARRIVAFAREQVEGAG
jgi:HEPN domain-containing protein